MLAWDARAREARVSTSGVDSVDEVGKTDHVWTWEEVLTQTA